MDFSKIESHQILFSETLNKLLELRVILDDVDVWEDIIDMCNEFKMVINDHKKLFNEIIENSKNPKIIQELKANMLVFEIMNKNIENIKYYAKMKNRLKLSDNIDDIEEIVIQYIKKENELLFPTLKELTKD